MWAGYMGTGGMVTDYEAFIKRKQRRVEAYGFDIGTDKLNPNLFDWQKRAVQWAIKRGRAALFEECGLGKTLQQLEWARLVHQHCGLPVVVHCPVGVRSQTKREAEKFGIDSPVTVADSQDEVINGINLINYEKLHKFDPATFCGVVLDESSILKGMNSVTRKLLKESYGQTRFRLACTATPAPNDHMELGNHAEFLGICEPVDMLNRYFVHDSGDTSKWRLRGHAERDFWSWVSQWAVCISKPSDIGGEDAGYTLPQMIIERHHVTPEIDNAPSGMLFNTAGISATTMHEEKRLTNEARCKRAAELAKSTSGPVLIWCDTNYEADELRKHLPDAVEVRGDDTEEFKDQALEWFCGLTSKPNRKGMMRCKKATRTSEITTGKTEPKRLQQQPNGCQKIENEESSTWKSTDAGIQISLRKQKSKQKKTTLSGDPCTHQTQSSEASALDMQREGRENSVTSNFAENTESPASFTQKFLSDRTEDVRFAEQQKQATGEASDCILTTATKLEESVACYAQSATRQSADSMTQLNCCKPQLNTFHPILITKPSIFGFGVNLQHCDTQIFAGLSYSFEAYYQAVRRSWRFGQKKPVKIHIVIADSDSAIESAVARKESDHAVMQSGMAQAMSCSNGIEWNGDMLKQRYRPSVSIQVPSFIEGAVACK